MTIGAARRLRNSHSLAQALLVREEPEINLFRFLVDELMQADGDLSPMQASDLAEDRIESLLEAVDEVMSAKKASGVTPSYDWQGDRGSAVLVSVTEIPSESPGTTPRCVIVGRRTQIRRTLLDSSFGDSRFERVCSHLLQVYGAESDRAGVTRPSGDGGIDFYGIYEPGAESGPRRLATQPYRIAGQAKRWSNSVAKTELELFVGRLRKWRHGAGDGWSDLPVWFRESHLPILGLFMTTSTFQRPALCTAAEGVCVCLDGEQISEDLATSSSAAHWFDAKSGELNMTSFIEQFDA